MYNKRLARAKSVNQSRKSLQPGESTTGFSLDLSGLPDVPQNKESVKKGDHSVGDGGTITTPRAAVDEVVPTPRNQKHAHKQMFKVGPQTLGPGRFKFAWRPGASMLATASTKDKATVLHIFRRDGTIYNQHRCEQTV